MMHNMARRGISPISEWGREGIPLLGKKIRMINVPTVCQVLLICSNLLSKYNLTKDT